MNIALQNHYENTAFTSAKLICKSSKTITEEVLKSRNRNNKIGYGSEGIVYKIPNTNYCVKFFHKIKTKISEKWTRDISEKEKINHILAKFGKKIKIMKYLPGKSLEWDIPDEVYDLPQSSYKRLLKQITNANNCGMYFDHMPANIIYNPQKKTLPAIDFYEGTSDDLRCYQPYTQVFECLKTKDKLNNSKLGNKLLNIALKEFLQPQNSKIYTDRLDITRMITKIRFSQDNPRDENFDKIQKMMMHISITKQHENFGEINKEKLLKQAKQLKELIKSTFPSEKS